MGRQKIRLFDFLVKNIMPYAAKQQEIAFRISLILPEVFENYKINTVRLA